MRHGRWTQIGVGAAATIVLLADVGVLAARPRPVDVHEVVARFRAEQSAPDTPSPTSPSTPAPARTTPPASPIPTPKPTVTATTPVAPSPARASATPAPPPEPTPAATGLSLPEAGVYTYATVGGEHLHVPGGQRRYPPETMISLTHDGCGMRTRWQPLRERWETTEECVEADVTRLASISAYHEFFGRDQTDRFVCEPGFVLLPASVQPGTTWHGRCTSTEGEASSRSEIVGVEVVDVGGRAVETVQVRVDTELSGRTRGMRHSRQWLVRSSGLLVRSVTRVDVESDTPTGRVRYTEDYELHLTDLRPRR